MRNLAIVLALGFLFGGCYHARIETGLTPGMQTYEKAFASSWIYGLVPPKAVEAAKECPNGVAVVETELSFVNQLVGILTSGIYTPMHITVTCASGSGGMGLLSPSPESPIEVGIDADLKTVQEAFGRAADQTAVQKAPVYVQFK